MKVAFYAPMKHPSHAVPSGDLEVANSLLAALKLCGFDTSIASKFRTWQREPSRERQSRLARIGVALAERLLRRFDRHPEHRPDVWFTYHLYHKAPDWIGPLVAERLAIPYVLAEASFAPKQSGGPWDFGHRAAQSAIEQSDLIFSLNSLDTACVQPLIKSSAKIVPLRPFTQRDHRVDPADRAQARWALAARYGLDENLPWLLTVAMMREGAKQQSYEVLAAALNEIGGLPWQLLVAGDGPARERIQDQFDPGRVVFTGLLGDDGLSVLRSAADLYLWPSVNEAYGMATLEAQASGVPAIVGDAGGVADIVRGKVTGLLVPEGDVAAFAAATSKLLEDPEQRQLYGEQASQIMAQSHSLPAASKVIGDAIREVVT